MNVGGIANTSVVIPQHCVGVIGMYLDMDSILSGGSGGVGSLIPPVSLEVPAISRTDPDPTFQEFLDPPPILPYLSPCNV